MVKRIHAQKKKNAGSLIIIKRKKEKMYLVDCFLNSVDFFPTK